jgi:hypothetical protein
LTELYASGRIVDIILCAIALEMLLLIAIHRRTGRGLAPVTLLANTLAGVCLLLALRTALVGADWTWIALCMFGALLAHLADLWQRSRE